MANANAKRQKCKQIDNKFANAQLISQHVAPANPVPEEAQKWQMLTQKDQKVNKTFTNL
jgi:hypothetical protein